MFVWHDALVIVEVALDHAVITSFVIVGTARRSVLLMRRQFGLVNALALQNSQDEVGHDVLRRVIGVELKRHVDIIIVGYRVKLSRQQ